MMRKALDFTIIHAYSPTTLSVNSQTFKDMRMKLEASSADSMANGSSRYEDINAFVLMFEHKKQ